MFRIRELSNTDVDGNRLHHAYRAYGKLYVKWVRKIDDTRWIGLPKGINRTYLWARDAVVSKLSVKVIKLKEIKR